ncbi:hypothetical protein [Streptacidiphilus sp. PAMC 29251]
MSLLAAFRPRPQVSLPPSRAMSAQWHYRPPEPGLVPAPRLVPIPGSCPLAYEREERRDCSRCGGEYDARVRVNGFRCLHCNEITYL